jgi:hypothetical protein
MPPRQPAGTAQGRHARTGPNAPARGRHASPAPASPPARPAPRPASPAQQRAARRYADYERRQEQQRRGQRRAVAGRAARVPGRGVRTLHQGARGGQHALMAEFLVFCGLVAMRAIADYVPSDQGTQTEGTAKGSITGLTLAQQQADEQHGKPAGQLGPLPVLAAGFVIFFVLSFLAARGGTWAKFAAAAGLVIDTALLLKSMPELHTVSQAYAAGTGSSSAPYPSTYVQPVGYEGTATVPEG